MSEATTELTSLLSAYSPAVREVALELRGVILSAIPGAREMVDAAGRVIGYGFGSGYKDLICTIILSKTGVKLGMVGGAALPDPTELLQGSGKKHRYVLLNTLSDLRRPGLKQLLKAATVKR